MEPSVAPSISVKKSSIPAGLAWLVIRSRPMVVPTLWKRCAVPSRHIDSASRTGVNSPSIHLEDELSLPARRTTHPPSHDDGSGGPLSTGITASTIA